MSPIFILNHAKQLWWPFLDGVYYDSIRIEVFINILKKFSKEEVYGESSTSDGSDIHLFQHCLENC